MKTELDVLKAVNPIFEIQFYLKDMAQINTDIPTIIPTGVYDPQTQRAVSEFQRNFNMPVTGKVDFPTWNAIIREHNKSIQNIRSPKGVCCFPDYIMEYKKGDECDCIYILQIILKNYHKKYGNYPNVQLIGVFDDQTEAAIREFQKCSKLPVTGILDRQTWNMLNSINKVCKLYE